MRDRTWWFVACERRDILDLLQDLSPEEWLQPSLCAGWRVRDVAAHLLHDEPERELGRLPMLWRMARLRLDVHRANAWWVAHWADRPVEDLLHGWERTLALGPAPVARHLFGPDAVLRGLVIHHQDIRRPLGRPRSIPADRLIQTLDFVLSAEGRSNLETAAYAEGLSLRATDLGWQHGSGPEVRGTGEALLMTIAGRTAAMSELEGPGVALLHHRLESPSGGPSG